MLNCSFLIWILLQANASVNLMYFCHALKYKNWQCNAICNKGMIVDIYENKCDITYVKFPEKAFWR